MVSQKKSILHVVCTFLVSLILILCVANAVYDVYVQLENKSAAAILQKSLPKHGFQAKFVEPVQTTAGWKLVPTFTAKFTTPSCRKRNYKLLKNAGSIKSERDANLPYYYTVSLSKTNFFDTWSVTIRSSVDDYEKTYNVR